MHLKNYIVSARRKLPGGLVTQVTKAISEATPNDAVKEFCSMLGISPQLLDNPAMMGTGHWSVVIVHVPRSKFVGAVEAYNLDPIRADFRAGCPEWLK